ncbi:DUF2975 domain-containing protein [Clostridium sp. 19966]|uniref:DUF2975 domain-containing protein n=1 Tax=Clostridium sp. 19966 TaxID=2768166 RepID=UPI0028DFD5D5|nr:DUF2975 domain-containing protein [Clostridium sp. 19966]MDT8719328.1 DUF2975 domain-containing protein [Clostridium sp. 19966]
MKYYGRRSLSQVLKIILDILLLLGAAYFIETLYQAFILKDKLTSLELLSVFLLLIVGCSCVFIIVINIRAIMNSLVKENPFTRENVKALKRMSACSIVVAICYIINLIINFSSGQYKLIYIDKTGIHTDMEFLIFLFAGLFIYVLAKVFENAVEVKEENDYTV